MNTNNTEKKIYILHEFFAFSHFKALYHYCQKNNIEVKYSSFSILKNIIKMLFGKRNYNSENIINSVKNIIKLCFSKDKIVVLGIAPYDIRLLFLMPILKKHNIIYFSSWHDWDHNEYPKKYKFMIPIWEKFLKDVYSLGVTPEVTNNLKEITHNSSTVFHSIDYDKYIKKSNFSKKEKKKFIFMGRLIKLKGILWIIKFLKKNPNLNIEISIFGDGKLKDEVINYSKEDNRLRYCGFKSKQEIKEELNFYDFLLLPSFFEPFGIVIIEAMAAGVIPVCSDNVGPEAIIKNEYNGFLYDKNSFNEFSNTIKKCVNIKLKRQKELSENCILEAKKYDKNVISEVWKDCIEKVKSDN